MIDLLRRFLNRKVVKEIDARLNYYTEKSSSENKYELGAIGELLIIRGMLTCNMTARESALEVINTIAQLNAQEERDEKQQEEKAK